MLSIRRAKTGRIDDRRCLASAPRAARRVGCPPVVCFGVFGRRLSGFRGRRGGLRLGVVVYVRSGTGTANYREAGDCRPQNDSHPHLSNRQGSGAGSRFRPDRRG